MDAKDGIEEVTTTSSTEELHLGAVPRAFRFLSRHRDVAVLTACAMIFVPVPAYFGLLVFVAPAAWTTGWGCLALCRLNFPIALFAFVQGFIYLGLYAAAAAPICRVLRKVPWQGLRVSFYAVLVAALFSCSFLRVVHSESLGGNSGTYHLWGALPRVLKKCHIL